MIYALIPIISKKLSFVCREVYFLIKSHLRVTGSFSQVPFAKSLFNTCYKAPMSLDLDASGTKLTDWIAPNRAVYHNEWIIMTALADETELSNAIDAEEKDPTSADSDEIFSDSHAWLEDDTPKQPAELSTMSAPTPSGSQALSRRKIH